MTHRFESRVRKLEMVNGASTMQIVSGRSDREMQEAVSALIASGSAKPNDFFVRVRRFAEAA
jgi:hypothetical protein